jgi:hypothetical protein
MLESSTAGPQGNVALSERDARDLSAFLYTLD